MKQKFVPLISFCWSFQSIVFFCRRISLSAFLLNFNKVGVVEVGDRESVS